MIRHLLFISMMTAHLFGLFLGYLPVPRMQSAPGAKVPSSDAIPIAFTVTSPDPSEAASVSHSVTALSDSTPPVIDVWYGNNQSFTLGASQNWLNILGNAADPESGVTVLTYTLNGSSSRSLSLGPDGRRLALPGDFNIDIALSDSALRDGSNTVTIRAVNGAGLSTQSSLQFSYSAGQTWSMPYSVRWSSALNIQQAAQVVDGKWQIVPGGVRTVETGYDRVLAVGDLTWKDFEILIPVTINAIDVSKYGDPIGVDPGIGINLHWLGHSDDPVQCGQPKCGWNPTGASVWYEFFPDSSRNNLSMQAYPPYDTPTNPIAFTPGGTYWIRAQVQVNAVGSLYKAKAWADGSAEPSAWMFSKQTDLSNLNHGSLLLVAHYVDVTFGDISIAPVSAKLSQFLTFNPIQGKTYGDGDFQVNASASSGLPVSYQAAGPCAVSGSWVSITGAGSCTITASQPGDAQYAPAQNVPVTFAIAKAEAALALGDLLHTYDGAPKPVSVMVSPSSVSGVSIQYNGSSAIPVNAGNYTITAKLSNANYQAAQVTGTLEIARADQAITITTHAPETALAGSSFTVAAISSVQGLNVAYTSGSPSTCTNNGAVFTITGQSGVCIVHYDQSGDQNYAPALQTRETVSIASRVFLPIMQRP